MPKGRKRAHAQIRVDIPQEDAIVTHVEVTRGLNQQILTKSTKVSVPVANASTEHDHFQAPETSPPSPEDEPAPAVKKARKGPSRSVAVCYLFLPPPRRTLIVVFVDNA